MRAGGYRHWRWWLPADNLCRVPASRACSVRHPRHGFDDEILFCLAICEEAARENHGAALNQENPIFASSIKVCDARPAGGRRQVRQIIDESLRRQAERERLLYTCPRSASARRIAGVASFWMISMPTPRPTNVHSTDNVAASNDPDTHAPTGMPTV